MTDAADYAPIPSVPTAELVGRLQVLGETTTQRYANSAQTMMGWLLAVGVGICAVGIDRALSSPPSKLMLAVAVSFGLGGWSVLMAGWKSQRAMIDWRDGYSHLALIESGTLESSYAAWTTKNASGNRHDIAALRWSKAAIGFIALASLILVGDFAIRAW